MKQQLLLITGSLLISANITATDIEPTLTAPPPPSAFQIMSADEMAAHQKQMQSLTGQAREDYKNSEYRKLILRARDSGYLLPETPPWEATNPDTAADTSSVENAAEPPAIQQVTEEHKITIAENVPAAENVPVADDPQDAIKPQSPVVSENLPSEQNIAYRKAMKARFERYMDDRQKRIDEMEGVIQLQQGQYEKAQKEQLAKQEEDRKKAAAEMARAAAPHYPRAYPPAYGQPYPAPNGYPSYAPPRNYGGYQGYGPWPRQR